MFGNKFGKAMKMFGERSAEVQKSPEKSGKLQENVRIIMEIFGSPENVQTKVRKI